MPKKYIKNPITSRKIDDCGFLCEFLSIFLDHSIGLSDEKKLGILYRWEVLEYLLRAKRLVFF